MLRLASLALVAAALLQAAPSLAADPRPAASKAKPAEKKEANVDELFDTPKAGSSLNDVKKMSEGISTTEKAGDLAPKTVTTKPGDGKVTLVSVFAAEQIVVAKRGCVPGGRDRRKLSELSFDALPSKTPPLQVCLTLSSAANREMRLSTQIVDPRGIRAGKAESMVDFRDKASVDVILEFPAMPIKMEGPYQYVVQLDADEAGRLQLFKVRVGDAPSAKPVN